MDLLQISRSTVNRLIKTHELHSIKLGKSRRFQREAIEEYIAQRPQS
jgi:excisionase family DNA binding protein